MNELAKRYAEAKRIADQLRANAVLDPLWSDEPYNAATRANYDSYVSAQNQADTLVLKLAYAIADLAVRQLEVAEVAA